MMPILQPVPIPTKRIKNPLKRAWVAWTSPRRWMVAEDYRVWCAGIKCPCVYTQGFCF